eukprot:1058361-Rhodomonas_salina.2
MRAPGVKKERIERMIAKLLDDLTPTNSGPKKPEPKSSKKTKEGPSSAIDGPSSATKKVPSSSKKVATGHFASPGGLAYLPTRVLRHVRY